MTGLTEQQIQDLHYFVHDKDHVMMRGKRLPAMEVALRTLAKTCRVPLYRGLYAGQEVEWLAHGHPTDSYTSFSERPEFARQFAKRSGIILKLVKGRGFAYSDWLKAQYRAETNPRIRSSGDYDFMEETCDEEREWILGFPVALSVTNDAPGTGVLKGLRVVTVTPRKTAPFKEKASIMKNAPLDPALMDPSVLVTDERSVLGIPEVYVSLLDRELRTNAVRCPVTLYRGLTKAEITDQGDTFVAEGYVLMTERPHVALGGAQASETDTVLMVDHAVGVDYHAFLARHQPAFVRVAEESLVEARIARAKAEREWIIAPGTGFKIVSRAPGSGMFAQTDVARAKPADESNTVDELIRGRRASEVASGRGKPLAFGAEAQVRRELGAIARTVVSSTRHDGWIERAERWSMRQDPNTPPVPIVCGYTPRGAYIGSAEDARHLVEECGIQPEYADPDRTVCTVGYQPREKKWYGWRINLDDHD